MVKYSGVHFEVRRRIVLECVLHVGQKLSSTCWGNNLQRKRQGSIPKYVPHVQHDCFCYSSNNPCFLAFSIFKVFLIFTVTGD